MTKTEKQEISEIIERNIIKTQETIVELKEITKPIAPENAIGRISRMDAINNKSVNEAALREAKKKLELLLKSREDVKEDYFGLCRKCGIEIQLGRLKFRPESTICMSCKTDA